MIRVFCISVIFNLYIAEDKKIYRNSQIITVFSNTKSMILLHGHINIYTRLRINKINVVNLKEEKIVHSPLPT